MTMASEKQGEYLIGTNSQASARLNLQHYWTHLSCGFLIHPDIPVPADARIADIATGTGIWPISLSSSLPASVQLNGFDITNAQFPPLEWLPANVTLSKLDVLAPIPDHLQGKYDVVCIRYFGLVIRNNEHMTVLKHLVSLLKPGGYIQWIEADLGNQTVVSPRPSAARTASEALDRDGKEFFKASGISYDWLQELPESCKSIGMTNVRQFVPAPEKAIRPIFGASAIAAWEEFSHQILDVYGPNPILGTGEEFRKRLRVIRGELEQGTAFEQQLYVVVAQLP